MIKHLIIVDTILSDITFSFLFQKKRYLRVGLILTRTYISIRHFLLFIIVIISTRRGERGEKDIPKQNLKKITSYLLHVYS